MKDSFLIKQYLKDREDLFNKNNYPRVQAIYDRFMSLLYGIGIDVEIRIGYPSCPVLEAKHMAKAHVVLMNSSLSD
jgi:hypothetical protein